MKKKTLHELSSIRFKLFIGPLMIALIGLFLVVLFLPLLSTRVPLISNNEIVLSRVAYDLFFVDKFLFVVVFVFGMLLPAIKMICTILCWYRFSLSTAKSWINILSVLGKLSMLDVMLLAIFIVAFKGLGIGVVKIMYGLYAYVALVIGSLLITLVLESDLRRQINTGGAG